MRVAGDPFCPECHRDKDWNQYTQVCQYIEGCSGFQTCGPEEDADFEAIELLAGGLMSGDVGAVADALDTYGDRLALSKRRGGVMLFGGCSKDLILAFIPVSDTTINLLSEAGLKSPETYLAEVLGDR